MASPRFGLRERGILIALGLFWAICALTNPMFREASTYLSILREASFVGTAAIGINAKIGTAKTWIALERQKEAKDSLKKLREKTPKEPLVIFWLGRSEEVLGNKKVMGDHLNMILTMS